MKFVYLVDIRQEDGTFHTYKCAFQSKEAARRFARLCKQETKISQVSLVSVKDI